MTRQELTNKTVAELTDICKENGLTYYKGKKKLTKAEMVEKILVSNDIQEDILKTIQESAEETTRSDKSSYVETVQLGTLVAFREPETGKLNTAKVVAKNSKNRMLKLITQYDAEFIVSYDSIAWVKTGARWPRGIYNELKGISNE